jgi:hypothetical protein
MAERVKSTKHKNHIARNTVGKRHYAQLRLDTHCITLGRYDALHPTALLDLIIKALPDLTVNELIGLRDAIKDMREPNRGRGRPRKHRRI